MSCLACVRNCPYGAPFIDTDGKVSHNPIICTGCGICAGVCPAKAFQVNGFKDDQIGAMIDAATCANPDLEADANKPTNNMEAI